MADNSTLRSKRSSIWMHFSPGEGKPNKAKCDTCGNEYSYSGGSTSNLGLHLRTKHPSLANDLPRRKKQRTSTPVGPSTSASQDDSVVVRSDPSHSEPQGSSCTTSELAGTPRPSCSRANLNNNQTTLKSFVTRPVSVARQKRMNDLLLNMIVIDFQPFSIMEDAGFREFVGGLDPSFIIPSRHMLSRELLPAKYNQAVDSVKKILATTSAVTLTTDSWTSICTQNYIAVTAHYITENFHLGSCLLDCFKFTDRHMAENLKTELLKVVDEWGIKDKIVAVVTDNAANIQAAVRLAGFKQVSCFAHSLNLVVQNALKKLIH